MAKKSAVKAITDPKIFANDEWIVSFGRLNAGRGAAGGVKRLFRVVGEKIPLEAIHKVSKRLKAEGIARNGVYVAHDSMGYARYIGRGSIFSRLTARWKAQVLELKYFSFYVVAEKKHEREIETLLIHAAGPAIQHEKKAADHKCWKSQRLRSRDVVLRAPLQERQKAKTQKTTTHQLVPLFRCAGVRVCQSPLREDS